MKPCESHEWFFQPNMGSWDILYYDCGIYPDTYDAFFTSQHAVAMSYYMYGTSVDLGPYTFVAGASKLQDPFESHYDRWVRCKPTMATRANMAVFFYELREIKRMFEIIPRMHLRWRGKPVESWFDFLRRGNSMHLNWNFGWKPFVRDILSCWEGLATFDKRLNKLLQGANEDLRRHARSHITIDDVPSVYWNQTNHPGFKERIETRGTLVLSSTFDFSYCLPPYSVESLRWRAYMDTIGLAATPANVWAIIPWSFVWDWFLRLGPKLERYSMDWIQPWIYFCQCCTSAKLDVQVNLKARWDFTQPNQQVRTTYADIGTNTLSLYTRKVGLPAGVPWSSTGTLNADKIRLLASLVGSKVLY